MSAEERISALERALRLMTALVGKSARFWLLVAVALLWWLLHTQSAQAREEMQAQDAKYDRLERDFREHLTSSNAAMVTALDRNSQAFERVQAVLERLGN